MFISKQDFMTQHQFERPYGGKYEMCKLELPVEEEQPNKLVITGKNTATYYQPVFEMGVGDEEDGTVIVEEDDGYCD